MRAAALEVVEKYQTDFPRSLFFPRCLVLSYSKDLGGWLGRIELANQDSAPAGSTVLTLSLSFGPLLFLTSSSSTAGRVSILLIALAPPLRPPRLSGVAAPSSSRRLPCRWGSHSQWQLTTTNFQPSASSRVFRATPIAATAAGISSTLATARVVRTN